MKRQQVKNQKASTRLILVHVQKMYKTYIYIGVPDYSSSSLFVFFQKMKRKLSPPEEKEAIPPPPDKQNTPGILYRNTNTNNTTGIVFKKMKRKLSPPPDKQNTPGILYRNTNTTGKKIK